jgi:transketolase
MAAADLLAADGHSARVVSMPCVDLFLEQGADYQESVLPAAVDKRLAIEAGSPALWYRFVGPKGGIIGLDRFGASAPAADLFKHFGFTPDDVARTASQIINN